MIFIPVALFLLQLKPTRKTKTFLKLRNDLHYFSKSASNIINNVVNTLDLNTLPSHHFLIFKSVQCTRDVCLVCVYDGAPVF